MSKNYVITRQEAQKNMKDFITEIKKVGDDLIKPLVDQKMKPNFQEKLNKVVDTWKEEVHPNLGKITSKYMNYKGILDAYKKDKEQPPQNKKYLSDMIKKGKALQKQILKKLDYSRKLTDKEIEYQRENKVNQYSNNKNVKNQMKEI